MTRARKIHARVSLFIALPILWIFVTGLTLWLALMLRESTYPYSINSNQANSLTELEQMRSLEKSLSGVQDQIKRITFADPGLALRVNLVSGEIWYYVPGEIAPFFKSMPKGIDKLIGAAQELHRGKIFGTPGRFAVTLFGFSMIAYLMTGIFLLKERGAKKGWRKRHRLLGWVVVVPLLSFIISGSLLNIASEIRPSLVLNDSSLTASSDIDAWTNALIAAREREREKKMTLIARVGKILLVEFQNGRRIYSAGGLILSDSAPWTQNGWIEASYPVHSGRAWGLSGRIVLVATGLLSLALVLSGLKIRRRSLK